MARAEWLPTRCELRIEGHPWGACAFSVDDDGDGWYETRGSAPELIEADESAWRVFWATVDAIGAWEWTGAFASNVRDGTRWSFLLEHDDRRLEARGSNAYPPEWGKTRGPEFEGFLDAIERLTGGRRFREPARPRMSAEERKAVADRTRQEFLGGGGSSSD